jgi:NAD(P)-dependent dehydrogenase (short-subunit alcohol dehydrogenase family)
MLYIFGFRECLERSTHMKSLHEKVVLITGAGGGFGQAMIRQFLHAGSHLILSDLHAPTLWRTADAVVSGLEAPAGKILGCVEADLSSAAGCDTLYQQCRAVAPALDILVNNAGIAFFGPFADVPQEKWERLVQVNLLAPMRLTAKFLPAMIARRSGHIVNVVSVAGLIGAPGLSTYSAAKFGLRGFAEALHAEVRPYGIDVTNIYPFFAQTPILQSERFGPERKPLPDQLLYDPDFVIAELIRGIRRGKLHVLPGVIPRQIDFLRRMTPWAMPLLGKLLRKVN